MTKFKTAKKNKNQNWTINLSVQYIVAYFYNYTNNKSATINKQTNK